MEPRLPKDPAYRRLRASRVFSRTTYWLAADHLLVVSRDFFFERYRRFDLQDLESVVIRPTSMRAYLGGGLALLDLGMFALTAFAGAEYASGPDEPAVLVWLILAAIGALALGIALAGVILPGRFCQARLTTTVQTLKLPGLNRMSSARGFVAELQQAMQAAGTGGRLTPPVESPDEGSPEKFPAGPAETA